jgi:hypothetical protein
MDSHQQAAAWRPLAMSWLRAWQVVFTQGESAEVIGYGMQPRGLRQAGDSEPNACRTDFGALHERLGSKSVAP